MDLQLLLQNSSTFLNNMGGTLNSQLGIEVLQNIQHRIQLFN
jgi:hypothetical protein